MTLKILPKGRSGWKDPWKSRGKHIILLEQIKALTTQKKNNNHG